MKLQFDFDNKVIKVEGNVNMGKLMERLDKHLPSWKKWELQTNTVINNWNSSIVLDRVLPYRLFYNLGGWVNAVPTPVTNTNSNGGLLSVDAPTTGIYNLELSS